MRRPNHHQPPGRCQEEPFAAMFQTPRDFNKCSLLSNVQLDMCDRANACQRKEARYDRTAYYYQSRDGHRGRGRQCPGFRCYQRKDAYEERYQRTRRMCDHSNRPGRGDVFPTYAINEQCASRRYRNRTFSVVHWASIRTSRRTWGQGCRDLPTAARYSIGDWWRISSSVGLK